MHSCKSKLSNTRAPPGSSKESTYKKWKSMLNRCYLPSQWVKSPSYKGVEVCQEWFDYKNFRSWFQEQGEDGELDKDLLDFSNRLYCPEKCVIVSKEVNNFLVGLRSKKCTYYKGVAFYPKRKTKPWKAQINLGNGTKFLGWYKTEKDAHRVWQVAKAIKALELSANQSQTAVRERLECIAITILDDWNSGVETLTLEGK